MKKSKRFLALLLVLCMLVSVVPFSVLAEEDGETTSEPTGDEGTGNQPAGDEGTGNQPTGDEGTGNQPAGDEGTGSQPAGDEGTGNQPAGDEGTGDENTGDEPAGDEDGIEGYTLDDGVAATSLTMGTKPEGGTTTENPFPKGTGGSNSFRIPAMVTLNNGTIVAAADARWNTTYDGGGLDTIVSYSKDNGANWNYTFANYLGDNGNTYNGSGSTAFIDPALATDGSTVYMLCDLYPYGVALNGSGNTAPSAAVGFNSDGKLLLSTDGANYNYYLDGTVIKDSSGNEVSGYTVDAYFNITGTDGTSSNLFFSDSPYKVVRTGYLYLTKSSDGGKNWSEPTLIPGIKTSSEQVCLVGPGRGLVTGSKIIFPVYSYNGSSSSQRMGFIYSSDGGATWSRSASFTGDSWSSEAAVVALKDGTLRFFYRNGNSALCYADYTWGTGWGSAVNTGIATNSNTQISAISYSKTVDSKQVILVSCPTGPNEAGSDSSSASNRLNGKIFVGYVNSDNTMTWQSDKAISVTSNNSQFMYSCLTELSNGKVAILYENKESAWGTGDNCYYTMDFQTYDLGLTFDTETKSETIKDASTNVEVTIDSGASGSFSMTVTGDQTVDVLNGSAYKAYDIVITQSDETKYTGSAKVTLPVGDLNTSNGLYGFVVESDGSITKATDGTLSEDGLTYTFTAPHFSIVGLAEEETKEDSISESEGTTTSYVLDTDGLDSGAQYLIVYKESASATSGVAINTAKSSVNVTIEGDKATPGGDASAALWKYTAEDQSYSGIVYATYYYLSNGSNYLYTTRTRNNGNWTYTLNIGSSKTRVILSSQENNSYFVTNTNQNSYVAYTNSNWAAQSGGQNLYFYKYTEGTQSWTVDPSLQEQRIINLTVSNDGYTTDSWNAYQTALDAANEKLNVVKASSYSSEADAQVDLDDLTALVDALEAAKNNLKKTVSITVNYQANGTTVKTETLNVADDAESVTLSSTVVGEDGKTYDVSNTTLSLNLANTTTYNVEVTEREGVALEINENETTTISVELTEGQYVKWSSADSNYVGVAGKYNTTAGAYTNEAILAGQNVTDSPVTVTGTVYNKDGTVAGTYKWLVTVTEGDGDTNTSSKGIYFNIDTIENCTVYYSINGGELIPVNGTGVTTGNWTGNGTYTGHFNIMFFAAPDEGYALTYMSISGSADQYYTLANGNPDGTGSDAWPFTDPAASTIPSSSSDSAWKTINGSLHGFRWALLEGNMTIDQMKVLFSNAIALGCDGATTITKNSTEGMGTASSPTVCKFVAQKLPTVEKTITSITRDEVKQPYTEDMKVKIGDTINYSVVVTRYATNASYGTITYDNETLTDELTNNNGISNPDMGTSTTSDQTYTYTTSITLTKENFGTVVKGGTITNTVEFSCTYSSEYSAGSLDTKASAVAEVTVDIPSYVVDFGLPVEINLTGSTSGAGSIVGCENGQYGTATVLDGGAGFTYTPTTILQGVDYVKFTYRLNGDDTDYTYNVAIYPATTVYYEEGFATYTGSWTGTDSKGSGTQKAQVAGSSSDEYGYDAAYASDIGASNNTQATSENVGDTCTFTFTGTGFEVYANCTTETGNITTVVITKDGQPVKAFMVDTAALNGESDATDKQSGNFYSLPVISEQNLAYGTYKVTITHSVNNKTVNIDGFRIYGTLDMKTDVYVNDSEDNPTFIELRDRVLVSLSAKAEDSNDYAEQIAKNTLSQVYATAGTTEGVVITSRPDTYTEDNLTDLLDNGPKNEIFLRNGQALTFTIATKREVQIGLKAPNAATSCTIEVDGTPSEKTISTSTDMFYKIVDKAAEATHTITITNTGSGILSITKLKVCDDPNAALGSLTAEDLVPAMLSLGFKSEPGSSEPTDPEQPTEPEEPVVTYADASLTVSLVDYTGKQLASGELTANGVAGETASFTAEQILSVASEKLPRGYALVDETLVTAADVTYGGTGTVTVQIGKVATLKITYVSLFGKKVGTATITKVQTSAGSALFTLDEIRANAPAGRRVIWLTPARVPFGSTITIVVPAL